MNWRTKARATAAYRQAAGYSALAARRLAGDPQFVRATVAIRLVVCGANPLGSQGRAQPTDLDNLVGCLKGGWDGVCDSGLLLDDSAAHLMIAGVTIDRHGKRDCLKGCTGSRVELVFTEVLP